MRTAVLLFTLGAAAWCQGPNQVRWTLSVDPSGAPPGSRVLGKLEADIQPGWHMYSLSTPPGGPIPTTIRVAPNPALEQVRILQPKPVRAFDKNFNIDTETYTNKAIFLIEAKLRANAPAGPVEIRAESRYQVCSETTCIPPVRRAATATITVDPSAAAATPAVPDGYTEVKASAGSKPPTAANTPARSDTQGLAMFLLAAFGFGLAALFTPCVFPMIPITMSFFLNRPSGSRRESLLQAALFCLGIIVLFTGLGAAATAILGPFGVVQIGSNPWVYGFVALVFLAFGLSLMGAFELTIPSSILTRLDQASQKGGIAGTLLMGLTFALTSFACVGPFVGTLLAASVQGGGARPLLGMLAFATGLALPFFFLALFPSYLKRMPRSGGWLARVKIVMGFVILAAMFKYLSSVDQVLQWNVLTRERYLAIWIVLFSMAGLYLLGFLRLEGINKDDRLGLGRLFTGMAFLIFAISLIPGMFGGKLGELDAYVPLATASPASGGTAAEGSLAWMKNQLREAQERARREGKNVFVSFTGYACTNCHWMKANMFTRQEIAQAMNRFVLVELYTDGTDSASEENQKLQNAKFTTIAIPYYAILDPDGNVVASFPGLTRNPQEFLAFLNQGAAAGASPARVAGMDAPGAAGQLAGVPITKLEGGAYDSSSLAGKVVVMNFWATWCVPCIKEIPSFNAMNKKLAPKGVVFLGVSLDEDGTDLVRSFLKDHPIEYDVALGSRQVGDKFQVSKLPTTLVFDRSGKQLQRFEGFTPEESLRATIQSALGETL
jgi:thiol:disulfide interchange protein